ncbi:MAG: 1-(5-phosphoribosyl)-5-[(5-phosphoribosylamino)methylideneamino]imidazole-4-carboxamide isomerase [Rhodospirillales bacterium]|nr:1-(5-phosphoribosyl)-5-[(5-phosphoribosylamino)methylideneamino]imidazole-4-carboxamide isomerase [Rhodospirillales bacterium]
MIFFPAIDLKDGRCVRLRRGDMQTATVFNEDPADQARVFSRAGCQWLHVVDLDGAFAGRPVNTRAVDAILNAVDLPVQLGGGIRTLATASDWLSRGVRRVILGTLALRYPDLVRSACADFPGRIAVGIDARDGRVAVQGWSEQSEISAFDLARRFEDAGVAAIIFTDIGRDGVMGGPNIEATADLARAISIPVILSGGISSLDDLHAVKANGDGIVAGVVCGRALYDGRIDPAEAVAVLAASGRENRASQC